MVSINPSNIGLYNLGLIGFNSCGIINNGEQIIITKNDNSLIESKLDLLYQRLIALAARLGIFVSKNDKISDIIQKIRLKLKKLEQDKKDSNINMLKGELEAIMSEYNNIMSDNTSIFNELDILAQTNRNIMGI